MKHANIVASIVWPLAVVWGYHALAKKTLEPAKKADIAEKNEPATPASETPLEWQNNFTAVNPSDGNKQGVDAIKQVSPNNNFTLFNNRQNKFIPALIVDAQTDNALFSGSVSATKGFLVGAAEAISLENGKAVWKGENSGLVGPKGSFSECKMYISSTLERNQAKATCADSTWIITGGGCSCVDPSMLVLINAPFPLESDVPAKEWICRCGKTDGTMPKKAAAHVICCKP